MNTLSAGWKIMFVVGVAAMVIGLGLAVVPQSHIETSGASLTDINSFNPKVAAWAVHASREATFSLFLLGFAVAALAWKPYRRGERWSWFALWVLTVGYIASNVVIHLAFGDTAYFPVIFVLLALSLAGLLLPIHALFATPESSS